MTPRRRMEHEAATRCGGIRRRAYRSSAAAAWQNDEGEIVGDCKGPVNGEEGPREEGSARKIEG